jgi:proline dehydrogenase
MAGHLFSKLLLGITARPEVESMAAHSRLASGLVQRFVAGDSLDYAILVTRQLNSRGVRVALDNLGENVSTIAEAKGATMTAIEAIERVHNEHLNAYLSIKLTQLGLDVGEYAVLDNAKLLVEMAAALGLFVRLDMEGSLYTSRTIEIFEQLRRQHDNVGIVIQAYLYRSMDDVRHLTSVGARIRLCKGAYDEPPHIAYRRKRDTDRNYVRIMEFLLDHGTCPAIATHDADIIDHARDFARAHGIDPNRFEFQMLYGVRRDLQEILVAEGYRVRVYVPYGTEWYPYMTRRLAERPANLFSIVGSMIRERRVATGNKPVETAQR